MQYIYRINAVLNKIFTTAIHKNKFQVFFFKCHTLVAEGFSTDNYKTIYIWRTFLLNIATTWKLGHGK